jgi:hypothetical protein
MADSHLVYAFAHGLGAARVSKCHSIDSRLHPDGRPAVPQPGQPGIERAALHDADHGVNCGSHAPDRQLQLTNSPDITKADGGCRTGRHLDVPER